MELFRDRLQWKYGFSFSAHETVFKFLTSSKEAALKWYNIVRYKCQVCGIHLSRDYVLGKMLSKNSYSKISLAEAVGDESSKFTVKSVFKGALVKNNKMLVICQHNYIERYYQRNSHDETSSTSRN